MAQIFKEMIELRRIYCDDNHFFNMAEFWNWFSEDNPEVKIKAFRQPKDQPLKMKAGVVAFGERVSLVVACELLESAKKGCKFSNFVLAHELAHLALDHHASNAVVKHFQLFETETGQANIPPTAEELEANFGATFFQCGVMLLSPGVDAVRLAHRANTDVYYTKKLLRLCALESFRTELAKISVRPERVIL